MNKPCIYIWHHYNIELSLDYIENNNKSFKSISMKKMKFFALALSAMLVVSSCGTLNNASKGGLIGGGSGAALGGVIGNIIGKDTKATAIGAVIGAAVGTGAGVLIGKHMDNVAEKARQIENAKVETITDANGLSAVKVSFDSGILFAVNKSDLNANSRKSLSEFAQVLKNDPQTLVDIQGHTDSSGNDQINIPLSEKRAQSVMNYLVQLGVPYSQFKNVAGYGSAYPVADNSTAAGKAQNRRVEVYVYASQEMIDAANAGTLR